MAKDENPIPLVTRIEAAKRDAGLLPSNQSAPPAAGRGMSMGIELAVAILGLTFAGVWLDGKLGTKPWLMLLGLVLGMVVGVWNLYRASVQMNAPASGDQTNVEKRK